MDQDLSEESLLRSVTLENARAVLLARERAERELIAAKEALEHKNRELAEQREWFRVTLSSIGDAVITTDTQCRITFLNPVAEALTGCPLSEALGQPLENVLHLINDVTRHPIPNPVLKVLSEGRPVDLANHTSLIARDGTEIVIEDSAAPIKDASGTVTGAVMVFHDATQRRRADEVIVKGAERLRLALEAGRLGDWAWDIASDLVTFGSRGAEIFGVPFGPPVTRAALRQLIHQEDRERARRTGEEALANRQDFEIEFRILRPSGDWGWVASRGRGLYSPAGEPSGMIGIIADITNRKRLDELQSRLAAVVESSDDAIVSTSIDGVITTWNEGAQRMYGFSAREAIGQPVTILLPEDRHDEEPAIIERLKRGERVEHYETLRCRKDGTFVDVSLSVSPIRDAAGNLIGASKSARDITQNKRAADELKRSEQRLRLITDAIPGLVSYIDRDYRYLYVSREYERWFNTSAAAVIGKRMVDILGPEAVAALQPFLSRAFSGEQVHFEMDVPYRHGVRSVNGFYIPDVAPDKTVSGIYVLIMDVTASKRAEDALKKAQEELSRHAGTLEKQVAQRTAHLKESIDSLEAVCYTIAHDLRSPLRAVQGFTKVLLDEYAPAFDDTGKQFATRIVNAAVRMDLLIQDLLRYAKLSHVDLPSASVDLNHILKEVRDDLAADIDTKHARFDVASLPVVHANPTIAQQVFTNLLANSLKFVRSGVPPHISIWSEPLSSSHVRVFIQDNGIGIAPEYHARIFGMFQRLHGDEQAFPGTGVGLAIVKKGMERIGGAVGICPSEKVGVCFHLDFPLPASS